MWVVGDSFSFCFTEYEDCWVTRFDQSTGLPTLNTAQGSTGSVSHWRFINTFGRTFEPPLVIWQFWVNDFNEDYQLAVLRGEIPESSVRTGVPDYPDEGGAVVQWLRANSVAWAVAEVALGNDRSDHEGHTKQDQTAHHSSTVKWVIIPLSTCSAM